VRVGVWAAEVYSGHGYARMKARNGSLVEVVQIIDLRYPRVTSRSHSCPVVSFLHGVLRQLEQIWGTRLWTAVRYFWFFLTGNRIVRNQRSRRVCPGK